MKLSQSSVTLLEDTIKKAVSKYTTGEEQTYVTDIHLQPDQNSGELSIFGDDFYKNTESLLSSLLNQMNNEGCFDKLNILKPYSFVLVDEDKETIAELLLMDDDTLLVNDELLKGLDEELDTFLKDLLEK